ncbi:dipeptidase [Qiania dongpingensis]|uniref:dipeptidase n=1 Tax=Qiania dongpingensis TaxID=2763669 RepID=UPI0020163BFB|nr:membrane dipeptidase [Qiania dongpingensis]
MLDYIDMHCDTLLVFADEGGSLYENQMKIDIRRLKKGGCLAQFFAIWMPDEDAKIQVRSLPEKDEDGKCPGSELALWDESYIEKLISGIKREVSLHGDEIAFAGSYGDLKRNEADKKISAFLTLEDGRAVGGELENLKRFYDMGIRLITLTWNHDNCFGRANYRDAVYGSKGSGLSSFGKEAVAYMNDLGMIVDVSHLSDEGFHDVAELCARPFVASHSNARALADCSRNMSDGMIRLLAEKGGVMGLNFAPGFLDEDFFSEHSSVVRMAAHARHILDCGGEGVLALGSDLDGITGDLEIDSPDKMYLLWEALKNSGFTERQLELVMRGNAERVIRDAMG